MANKRRFILHGKTQIWPSIEFWGLLCPPFSPSWPSMAWVGESEMCSYKPNFSLIYLTPACGKTAKNAILTKYWSLGLLYPPTHWLGPNLARETGVFYHLKFHICQYLSFIAHGAKNCKFDDILNFWCSYTHPTWLISARYSMHTKCHLNQFIVSPWGAKILKSLHIFNFNILCHHQAMQRQSWTLCTTINLHLSNGVKSFLSSNGLTAISFPQTLPFKSMMNKKTTRNVGQCPVWWPPCRI